jgi:hypothetical protein
MDDEKICFRDEKKQNNLFNGQLKCREGYFGKVAE